jgi:hypothetical protein
MLASPANMAADEMGIPSVINDPAGPYALMQSLGIHKPPNFKSQAQNWCGKLYVQ